MPYGFAMPRVTGIGGVFVRARDAEALRRWYSEHLGITIDGDSGAQLTWTSGGSTVFSIFAASSTYFGRLDQPALLLYAGAISWVIGYDTIYAHQDREDDAFIGIKSTALLFGARTKPMLAIFFGLAVVLIGWAGWSAGGGIVFALGLLGFAAHLAWQIGRLDIDDPALCLYLFKSNRDAGLILFAAFVLDAALGYLNFAR